MHAAADAYRRSLGVPAPTGSPGIELSALIPSWLPLRPPSVHLVAEADGQLIGSCRAITEPHRDDWVIIELDAADGPMAGEVRWALLEGLIEEGAKRERGSLPRGLRRTSARTSNCSGWPASWPTPRRRSCTAPPRHRAGGAVASYAGVADRPLAGARPHPRSRSSRPARPTRGTCSTCGATAPPPAIARVEDYHAADWESVGHEAIVPRSSLNPILHFGAVSAWLSAADQRAGGFAQHGASRVGPHYLRFLVRDGVDGEALLAAVLAKLPAEAMAAGILAPVRTYEAAGLSAAASIGFAPVGRVTLLVREVRATVRQPALVPAVN